ncbi:hypothetical protein O3684_05435, partial [Pauljensenia sp. 20925_1_27]
NHYTNHKQPTTHTHTNNTTPLAGMQATTVTGGRSHGVEREPDSVLVRINLFMPNPKNAPTPTTHSWAVNKCEHKKTNQAPTHRTDTMIAPQ